MEFQVPVHVPHVKSLPQVFDEKGKERTPKPMLSLRPNNMRPLPSLIGESQASVTSDTDRGSMMSEMGHLERLSSAAFSTGSSRMSAGYGSSSLTPELSMGSQMGISVSAMAAGLEHKVALSMIECPDALYTKHACEMHSLPEEVCQLDDLNHAVVALQI